MAEEMPRTFQVINLMPAAAHEIKNVISSLISRNSCGCDEISKKLLKIGTITLVFLKVIAVATEISPE
jgi:hypothetical protein